MDRKRAKEVAPIIKAFGDGEDIQFHDGDDWLDVGKGGIDAGCIDGGLQYRIKPAPREFAVWNDGSKWNIREGEANDEPHDGSHRIFDEIKVREVL